MHASARMAIHTCNQEKNNADIKGNILPPITCLLFYYRNFLAHVSGPDVMQSGFGVKFLFWSGEFEVNCRRISQRILMANFDSEFFGRVFPGFQATQKIHAQYSLSRIVGIPLQFHFLEPKIYSRRFSAYGGDQHVLKLRRAKMHV